MTTKNSDLSQEEIDKKLRALEVGDSFFLPYRKPDELAAIRKAGYRLGVTLSIRYLQLDNIDQLPGTRIWRTA